MAFRSFSKTVILSSITETVFQSVLSLMIFFKSR